MIVDGDKQVGPDTEAQAPPPYSLSYNANPRTTGSASSEAPSSSTNVTPTIPLSDISSSVSYSALVSPQDVHAGAARSLPDIPSSSAVGPESSTAVQYAIVPTPTLHIVPVPPKSEQYSNSTSTSTSAQRGRESPSDAGSASSSPTTLVLSSPPANTQRTSFIHTRRENWVLRGAYVLDPYLPLPPSAVSPQSFYPLGAPPRNMMLECKNGNITADVWIVGGDHLDRIGADASKRRIASMDVKGENGFVTVRVNADCSSHPFNLRVSAKNGGVSVAIPESYVGPLTTQTKNGWVTMSSALAARVTTFSDVKSVKKCFIGDFASSGYGQGEWVGCALDIICKNGRIKLCFTEELIEKPDDGKSILGRLFKSKS